MKRSFVFIVISIVFTSTGAIAGWSPMESGTTYWLNGIWGSSATDVYAVGDEGTILHYNGLRWRPMYSGTVSDLTTIWGSSGNDVFAVGDDYTMLHYDGSTWTTLSECCYTHFNDIWGTSGKNVYALVTDAGKGPPYGARIIHYDGQTWETVWSDLINEEIPFPITYYSPRLHGIWGSSSTDIFAVGREGSTSAISNKSTIIHYDGISWGTMLSGITQSHRAVWGSSSTDVFVVGSEGVILHYDGISWETMSSGITQYLRAVWGSSSTDVFVVGSEGVILHYDGISWSNINSGTTETLMGTWGSSGNNVFAVGGSGTILHFGNTAGCIIDKIYGEDSKQVQVLRGFRDNVLSRTQEGRELIKLYYQWSPVIVRAMEADEEFKQEIREIVDEVLGVVE